MAESKTILVVDDDMELSDGLRVVLEKQGHRVFQARDGQQGKTLIYQHKPDLVILDMMMPRMGGYPVLEQLRLIAKGPVLWAPAVDGALVVSLRGDDFELMVGQDLAIGYASHDAATVTLYLEESLTFRAAGPEAAVALQYATASSPARKRARRG